ncbi:hypothetical protein GALMADRAFT_1187647 [Galerina marginata CBS 339.88]|uniref:Transmembrane protein n=1 Tax=Galerina marginata (strain CBS 339.88) TaxID=685588 RepID=A0A067TD26_GALM3|nr:hypothetical protein GALMADRAFT_1187647 [Galerina marginata CBS 339.88]
MKPLTNYEDTWSPGRLDVVFPFFHLGFCGFFWFSPPYILLIYHSSIHHVCSSSTYTTHYLYIHTFSISIYTLTSHHLNR